MRTSSPGRHGDTDVEVGRRRGRRLGEERGRRIGVPAHARLPRQAPGRTSRAEAAAPDRESRSRTAPGSAQAKRDVDGDRPAGRKRCARAGRRAWSDPGGWSPGGDPADVTGPACEVRALARLERPVRPQPEDEPAGREVGRERHGHRPRHVAGRGDVHDEPVAGPGRVGRRVRRRRARRLRRPAAGGPRAAARRSARGRGEARGKLPPGALQVALLVGLASAPSQLLRRDGLDDSAHGNALDARRGGRCQRPRHDLARERLAVDPALGGDAQLGAVRAPAPGPASSATSAAPGTARAPSAISMAPIPPPAPAPGRSAVGSAQPSQPLLELGDLRRARRPSAARTPPPRRRGRAAGSARRAPPPARRRRARRRAPSRRPAPPSVEAVPPTPITTRERAGVDRRRDQLAGAADERAERIAAARRRPLSEPHASATSSTADPSIRRAKRAAHGRPSASWTSASRHSPPAGREQRRGRALAAVGERHRRRRRRRAGRRASPRRARPPPRRRCRCRAACPAR